MHLAFAKPFQDSVPGNHSLRPYYVLLFAFGGILIAALIVLDALAPGGRRVAKITGVEGPVYFGIAHSLLFDRDVDLTNEFQHVAPEDRMWTLVQKSTGRPGSVYPIGYSLVAMPFLLAGYAVDALRGQGDGGYGRFAVLGFSLTNVFLAGCGLIALFTFLVRAGKSFGIGNRLPIIALLVCFAIFFGTNVGFYTFSPMSHIATFFWASLFLAWWWEIQSGTSAARWAVLGIMGGMLSISRWQDVCYLGAPLLLDLLERRYSSDRAAWLRSRAAYAVAAVVCWVPQVLEWKSIFGHYLTIPQGAGFFEFPPVHVAQVLFSSHCGWFFWTPITLLGICGLVYGGMRISRFYWPLLVVFALELLVLGSLRISWSGHDSFGARYLTSSVPLAAFGLATIFFTARPLWRDIFAAFAAVSVVFTLLFAVQYRLDLIPRNSRLTVREAFGDKFHLGKAMKRRAAFLAATGEMQSGDYQAAVHTLEYAKAAYGGDRELLDAVATADRRAGSPAKAAMAEQRLRALLDSQLF